MNRICGAMGKKIKLKSSHWVSVWILCRGIDDTLSIFINSDEFVRAKTVTRMLQPIIDKNHYINLINCWCLLQTPYKSYCLLVIQELDSSSNYPTHNSEKYPTEIRMTHSLLCKNGKLFLKCEVFTFKQHIVRRSLILFRITRLWLWQDLPLLSFFWSD